MSHLRHTIAVGEKDGTVTLDTNSGTDIGTHDICNGCVDCRRVSELWAVLRCRACGMRVYYPAVIDKDELGGEHFYQLLIEYFERR